MLLLNPKKYQDRNYPDERSKEIMLKTIEFFENKALKKMKAAKDTSAAMPKTAFFMGANNFISSLIFKSYR